MKEYYPNKAISCQILLCEAGLPAPAWPSPRRVPHHFIIYNAQDQAPEILVDGDKFSVIRKRETYEDLITLEK